MVPYQQILAEIGRAWDVGYEDQDAVVSIVSEVKETLRKCDEIMRDKERREVLDELCDVTIQLVQQHSSSILSAQPSIESFSISKRVPSKQNSVSKRVRMDSSDCSTPCSDPSRCDPYRVSWQDIVGQDDAKRALYESCVLPTLLPPSLFVGARQLCTTVLLFGPPGTGKTTLVRAVANESHNYLLELSPSSCLSKWAGEAERRIQGFFAEARRRSPSILFLDEFDALAMRRESAEDVGARRVLSELLIQFTSVQPGDRVTIIASTNRLRDLDPAVVRRFQKIVELPLPSQEERERIIQKGLNGIAHQLTEEDMHDLGEATNGWSGSLLQAIVANSSNGVESNARSRDGSRVGGISVPPVRNAVFFE